MSRCKWWFTAKGGTRETCRLRSLWSPDTGSVGIDETRCNYTNIAPTKHETWEFPLLRHGTKKSASAQRSQVRFILHFQQMGMREKEEKETIVHVSIWRIKVLLLCKRCGTVQLQFVFWVLLLLWQEKKKRELCEAVSGESLQPSASLGKAAPFCSLHQPPHRPHFQQWGGDLGLLFSCTET